MSKKRALPVEVICITDSDEEDTPADAKRPSAKAAAAEPAGPSGRQPEDGPSPKRPRPPRVTAPRRSEAPAQPSSKPKGGARQPLQQSQSQGQPQSGHDPGGKPPAKAQTAAPVNKSVAALGARASQALLKDWLAAGPSQPQPHTADPPTTKTQALQPAAPTRTAAGSTAAAPRAQRPAATSTAAVIALAAERSGATDDAALGRESESWVDRHKPQSVESLAVHKKKVAEVRGWLESQLPANRQHVRTPRLLVVTGPAGCGKSTTVEVLAKELGFQLVEWAPSTHTTWSEARYQNLPFSSDGPRGGDGGGGGSGYQSKLEEFSNFLTRVRYAPLALRTAPATTLASQRSQTQQPASSSQPALQPAGQQNKGTILGQGPKLIVIDDLPLVTDTARRAELAGLLGDLAQRSHHPVVLVATDSVGNGAGEGTNRGALDPHTGLHKDIQAALDGAGAGIISFNPLTDANISKVLLQIVKDEGRVLSKAAADQLAHSAHGDLRHAVQALQLMFSRTADTGPQGPKRATGQAKRGRTKASGTGRTGRSVTASAPRALLPHEASCLTALRRDNALELFHALGKILYNKRDTDTLAGSDTHTHTNTHTTTTSPPAGPAQHQHTANHPTATSPPDTTNTTITAQHTAKANQAKGSGGNTDGGKEGKESNDKKGKRTPPPRSLLGGRGGGGGKGGGFEEGQGQGEGRGGVVVRRGRGLLQELPSLAFTERTIDTRHRRPPMRYDPEQIVSRSALEPLPLVSFLAANYLTFFDDSDVDACAEAAGYLSDAAYLATYRSPTAGYSGFWGDEEMPASDITSATACSVATRGLLYANVHPAPRRFTPMQGSVSSHLDAAIRHNDAALRRTALNLATRHAHVVSGSVVHALAAQVLPSLRVLSSHPAYHWLQPTLPTDWSHFPNGPTNTRPTNPHGGNRNSGHTNRHGSALGSPGASQEVGYAASQECVIDRGALQEQVWTDGTQQGGGDGVLQGDLGGGIIGADDDPIEDSD